MKVFEFIFSLAELCNKMLFVVYLSITRVYRVSTTEVIGSSGFH